MVGLSRRVRALERELAELHARQLAPAPVPFPATVTPEPAPPPAAEPASKPAAEPPAEPAADAPAEPRPAEPPRAEPRPVPTPIRPPPSPERIAAIVGAVLGGAALVVGGLLFLQWAMERGWLGPPLRVAASSAAGLALAAVSIRLRPRAPVVSAALAGAAFGVWYGATFAASSLYGLLSPGAASAGLVAITAAAAYTAARHHDRYGVLLALLGGTLAPVLIRTDAPNPLMFLAYLTVLAAGFAALGIARRWPELVGATALAVGALHLGWTTGSYHVDLGPLAIVGALLVTVPFAFAARSDDPAVAAVGRAAAALLPLVAVPWLHPGPARFTDPRTHLVVLRALPSSALVAGIGAAVLPAPLLLASRRADDVRAATLTAAVALATFTFGWHGVHEPPLFALAVAPPLSLALAVAILRRNTHGAAGAALPTIAAFATLGAATAGPGPALIAAPLVAVAAWFGARTVFGAVCLPGVAVGSTAAFFVATPAVAQDPVWLAVAVTGTLAALGPPVLLGVPHRPASLLVVALLPVASFVPLYAAWREVFGEGLIGALPLLLAVQPVLGAALLVRRGAASADTLLATFVVVGVAGLTAALPLQVESQWLVVGWSLEVLALAWASRRLTSPVVRGSALVLAAVVVARLVLDPNGLGGRDTGGWPILNWTLYAWGVPFLALLGAARLWPAQADPRARIALGMGAIAVGFALVNVEVSYTFQRAGHLTWIGDSVWQEMVRSVAWGVYGLAVLLAGGRLDRRAVRFVGFAIVLFAAVKVTVFDLWTLEGFVRVGALLGLGVVLILAALVFERLVLRTHKEPLEET